MQGDVPGLSFGLKGTVQIGIFIDQTGIDIGSDFNVKLGVGLGTYTYDEEFKWRAYDFDSCFLPEASIDMWPLDPSLSSDANGRYDEGAVRAAVWKKPIAEVSAGDLVVSYDAGGRLVPGKVSRTMVNRSRHILDVFGLMMTPGHVTLCGDGTFKGRHVPVIDILRTDGALVKADGSMIRAATGCALGSDGDRSIQVVAGPVQDNGEVEIRQSAELRAGTRVILDDGRDICLLDLIEAGGGAIRVDGLLDMPGQGAPVPFLWNFGETLPAPEDYVLQRSQLDTRKNRIILSAAWWFSGCGAL